MYDIFYIGESSIKEKIPTAKQVDSFEQAQKQSLTKMFWLVWSDVNVADDFDFTYEADDWSLEVTHVFKNGNFYDGICLIPKKTNLSKREIDYRFFVSKKEVDIVASRPRTYKKIVYKDYTDYKEQLANLDNEFVWIIPSDVEVDFDFNYQVPYWDKDTVHVMKNGLYNDGIVLHHSSLDISKREIDFSWFKKKVEAGIVASVPKPYDIVFISYNEPNADANYKALQQRFPRAKRIHGVKGIHQAHIAAAKLCDTDMFWIVDGDAQVVEDFDFDYQVPKWQRDQVFVWHSCNPINDLEYGYGGVKLFPRKETLAMDTNSTDMTTSISPKFNVVDQVSNITEFNTGEFETWKSAFRECAKLASHSINRQNEDETNERLKTWTTIGHDRDFGEYAIRGARAGMEFGLSNQSDISLINDFDWLETIFNK